LVFWLLTQLKYLVNWKSISYSLYDDADVSLTIANSLHDELNTDGHILELSNFIYGKNGLDCFSFLGIKYFTYP
jgi:hypothetical protein